MKLLYLRVLGLLLVTGEVYASPSLPESVQSHPVDYIRKNNLTTINVGGIGKNGKKEHPFWSEAQPNDFVISIDSQVNPHMLADGFSHVTKTPLPDPLKLNFFTEKELETLKAEKLIQQIKYEHVGYGFISSFWDEKSKQSVGAEQRISQLTSILPERGTFEYSSFWVGLKNYGRTPNALNPSVLSTSIGDLVGEKNSRTTSDKFEDAQQALDALNRRVFQLELKGLKLVKEEQKKENKNQQEELKKQAKILFENLSSQSVREIKGFEVFVRDRLRENIGTLELKPFSDHQEFFPSGSIMELYYDILKNKFGLGDIHFYIDKVNPLNALAEDKFLYCLRMTGVKGAEAQEIKPKISLKGSFPSEIERKLSPLKADPSEGHKKESDDSIKPIFKSIYSQKVEELFKSYLTPKNSLKQDYKAHNDLAEKLSKASPETQLSVKQDLEESLRVAVQEVFSSTKSSKETISKERIDLALRFQALQLGLYKMNPVKKSVIDEEL